MKPTPLEVEVVTQKPGEFTWVDASIHPTHPWLGLVDSSGWFQLWNWQRQTTEASLRIATENIHGIQFTTPSHLLLSVDNDSVNGWDLSTQQMEFCAFLPTELPPQKLILHPQGDFIAWQSLLTPSPPTLPSTTGVYMDLKQGAKIEVFEPNQLGLHSLDAFLFHPTHPWLIAFGIEPPPHPHALPTSQWAWWNLETNTILTECQVQQECMLPEVPLFSFGKSGQQLTTLDSMGTLRLFELNEKTETSQTSSSFPSLQQTHLPPLDAGQQQLATSLRKKLIATSDATGTIHFWARSGQRLPSLSFHEQPLRKLTFSQDGSLLLSLCEEWACLWRLLRPQEEQALSDWKYRWERALFEE